MSKIICMHRSDYSYTVVDTDSMLAQNAKCGTASLEAVTIWRCTAGRCIDNRYCGAPLQLSHNSSVGQYNNQVHQNNY